MLEGTNHLEAQRAEEAESGEVLLILLLRNNL